MRALMLGASAAGVATPVIADVWGYPFELAPMVMGVSSCVIVRVYKGLNSKSWKEWAIDATITALSVLFTFAALQQTRPNLMMAAVLGTGLGAFGAGLITLSERKARAMLGAQIGDSPIDRVGNDLRVGFQRPVKGRPPADQIDLLRKLDTPD